MEATNSGKLRDNLASDTGVRIPWMSIVLQVSMFLFVNGLQEQ